MLYLCNFHEDWTSCFITVQVKSWRMVKMREKIVSINYAHSNTILNLHMVHKHTTKHAKL